MSKYSLRLLGLILVLAVAACSPQAQVVSGADKDAVLVYSEAKSDNLLAGMNANDYATFSRDFDAQMKGVMTEAQFANTQKQVVGKIGKYVSRQVDRVERTGDFIAVVYSAKFENDSPVALRIVFRANQPHLVSGLWFDSAKLRQ